MNGDLYAFHLETGEAAEDMHGYSDEAKIEIADMMRHGARFYWHKSDENSEWVRAELANIRFVLDMIGIPVTLHEDAPRG